MEERSITKEEAVKILIEHRKTFQSDFGWNTSVLEALDMAIDALKDGGEKTPFIEKSNFDMKQYVADINTAYECGKASVAMQVTRSPR